MGREKVVILVIVALSTCFCAYGQEEMITDPVEGNLFPLLNLLWFSLIIFVENFNFYKNKK